MRRVPALLVPALLASACAAVLGIDDGSPRGDCGNPSYDVDVNNCGSCGHVCAQAQVCSNGSCKPSCDPPLTTCPGITGCVDLTKDLAHCGACSTACGLGDAGGLEAGNGNPILDSGTLPEGDIVAEAGPAPDAGAAWELGTAACIKSACTIQCPAQEQLCGRICFDTKQEHEHCGNCATACGPGETCSSSHCCALGQAYCGSACIDVLSDSMNCGACGKTCSGSTPYCFSGQCAAGLSIVVEGHANVVVPCAVGDYSCEAHYVCNKVTGLPCVYQAFECTTSSVGSWYPPDGMSGGSQFNFAFGYDFYGVDYGNICACMPSQMTKYGLGATHVSCGLGHWVRQ